MPQICNSAGFCFVFSKRVPLQARASNSATTESLSCWRLISHFHLLKAINTHRASGRCEMHNNRGWLFRINATTALPVFSFPGPVPETVWGCWWSYGLSCMHGMTDASGVWSMKDTDRVSQGKGVLQQRADLKDSSRLKLIEIPFVAFVACSVSSLPTPSPSTRSPFQCSRSEPSVSLNIKQIRLHLWGQAPSNLHGNNIKLWDFVIWTAIKKCVFVCVLVFWQEAMRQFGRKLVNCYLTGKCVHTDVHLCTGELQTEH